MLCLFAVRGAQTRVWHERDSLQKVFVTRQVQLLAGLLQDVDQIASRANFDIGTSEIRADDNHMRGHLVVVTGLRDPVR